MTLSWEATDQINNHHERPIMTSMYLKVVFTRGHFWPSGIVVACVCVPVCPCVRVSVCACINHGLVRTITHHSFNLESLNLAQRCKRPWLRCLLFLGMIDLYLQGQIQLESQILPHFEPHNSSAVQARITKFGPQIHLSTVKILDNFRLDWFWSSLSFTILKPIFLRNLFALFLCYI